MPAERRQFTATRPVKTERTHEENQERAYIAASRRSDRSLEARIESARRASEIHKRRTGRGLRVTEQDVINEEMYEEEDDDLPTQYLRLNAHLQTSSVMFNKKLHDYIATQHGVRNMFMSQYQSPPFQQAGAGGQHIGPGSMQPIQANNWLNPAMPSQQFNPSMQPEFQQAQPYTPTTGQQQGFRQYPYYIPQRQPPHQRSLSIQMPPAANFDSVNQQVNSGTSTPHGDITRRMSLPPHAFQQQAANQVEVKSQQTPLSQSPVQRQLSTTPQSVSPHAGSVYASPATQNDASTPSFSYSPGIFPFTSQALNSTPLTMSLPPESQQFIGSVLDPNDPRTAAFMSGSENVPQPFNSTSTYNHNVKPETTTMTKNIGKAAGSTPPLSSCLVLNLDSGSEKTSTGLTSISDGFFNNDSFLTPGNGDYSAFFDFQSNDHVYNGEDLSGAPDQLDGNSFINWD